MYAEKFLVTPLEVCSLKLNVIVTISDIATSGRISMLYYPIYKAFCTFILKRQYFLLCEECLVETAIDMFFNT